MKNSNVELFKLKHKYQAKKNKGRINRPLFFIIASNFYISSKEIKLCFLYRLTNNMQADKNEIEENIKNTITRVHSLIKMILIRLIAVKRNSITVSTF